MYIPGRFYIIAAMRLVLIAVSLCGVLAIVGVPFDWMFRLLGVTTASQVKWIVYGTVFGAVTIIWLAKQQYFPPDPQAEDPGPASPNEKMAAD